MNTRLALSMAIFAIAASVALGQVGQGIPTTAPGAPVPGGGLPGGGEVVIPPPAQPPAGGEGGVAPGGAIIGAMPGGQLPGQIPMQMPNGMRPAWAPVRQPGMQPMAPAVTGPEGLTPADKAVMKRFAESDWFDVRLSAGSRVYTLGKENKNINYTINRGGFDISKGSIPMGELVDKSRPTAASAVGESKPAIASTGAGGTLHPLKAWRYEMMQLPDGKLQADRVEYDAEELNKVKEDDIKFYEDLYRQNPPLLKEGETPGDPRSYAEWYYSFQQLRLWEQYVQRLIGKQSETMLPPNSKELPAKYPGLYAAYNLARDQAAEEEMQVLRDLFKGMGDREQARAEVKKAEKEKMVNVEKYAQDWARRDTGDTLRISGVNYIRTDEPLRFMPADSVNIVAPSITPHDLLKDDGTIKKPTSSKRK